MIRLKKLIAIAVLVSMLPVTVMAQGEGKKKNTKIAEGQNVSTTEEEPDEENLVEMTATSEGEVSESMEPTDEHSRYEENSGMSGSKRERESDGGCVEKMTTASKCEDTESSEESVCTVDAKEDIDMPRDKKARVEDKNSVGEMVTISEHEEEVKSAEDMYKQGVQCESNGEKEKAVKFYNQAAEMGHEDALSRLASIVCKEWKRERFVKVFKDALNGDADGMYDVFLFFKKFEEECDKWRYRALVAYQKKAELGDEAAIRNVGSLIEGRKGRDVDECINWCVNLVNSGNVRMMRFLASYYESIKDTSQLIFWLNRRLDAGDKGAVYKLIKLYEEGIEVPQDYSKIFEVYKKAIELGDTQYYYHLGMLYKEGEGVAQDYVKAKECFELAAEKKIPHYEHVSIYEIASLYENGQGVAQDLEKAFELYSKAALLHDDEARGKLGDFYERGVGGVCQDYNKAIKYYEESIKERGGYGAYRLGILYKDGVVVKQDLQKSAYMFKQAIEYNNIDAIYELANCYEKGIGVTKDLNWATALFNLATEVGDTNARAKAMYKLGMLCKQGVEIYRFYSRDIQQYKIELKKNICGCGMPFVCTSRDFELSSQEDNKAFKWFEEAASLGNADAMCELADFYGRGDGVPKDSEKMVELYQKAIDLGNVEAMCRLANCYGRGDGVPKDSEKMVELYQRAIDLGNVDAMYKLANCYEKGEIVKGNDYEKVLDWYYKACRINSLLETPIDELSGKSLDDYYKCGEELKNEADKKTSEWYKKAVDVVARHEKAVKEKNIEEMFDLLADCYKCYVELKKEHDREIYELYEKAADKGSTEAMCKLAFNFKYGKRISKDLNRAQELYRKAANLGDPDAMYGLACCYLNGEGVSQDLSEAVIWLQQAADLKNSDAICILAELIFKGLLEGRSRTDAISLCMQAITLGNANAVHILSDSSLIKDDEKLNLLQQAVDLGDTEAMCKLADRVKAEDRNRAISLYKEAADKGDQLARVKYDLLLGQKPVKVLLEESAKGKYVKKLCFLFEPYINEFAPYAIKQAWLMLCKSAVSLGDISAIPLLAKCYSKYGIIPNVSLEKKWKEKDREALKKCGTVNNLLSLKAKAEILYLEKEVRKGNTNAMYELGCLCEHGIFSFGSDYSYIDTVKAFKLYEQAAKSGHLASMTKVGVCYRDGKGVCKNEVESEKWLSLAAENGNVEGMHEYGVFLEKVKHEYRRACEWYRNMAKNGSVEAMRGLYECYKHDTDVPRKLNGAMHWLQQAADLKDPEAMRQLGSCFENGDKVAKDLNKAIMKYKRAAAKKNTKALCNLAFCFENEGKLSEAVKWLQLAVDLDDSDAMFKLASWYEQGKGVTKDSSKVVDLLVQAAENGHVGAMYKLGLMLVKGEGVSTDLKNGIRYLEQAANKGNIDAISALADCYKNGNGVPQDEYIANNLLKAVECLKSADESFQKAYSYEHSENPGDLNEAIKLYMASEEQYLASKDYYRRRCACEIDDFKAEEIVNANNGRFRCMTQAIIRGIHIDYFPMIEDEN